MTAEATRESLDESFEHLSQTAMKVKAERDELLRCLKMMLRRIEDGTLVRDITRDAAPDWAMRMGEFVLELSEAQAAISRAEGR